MKYLLFIPLFFQLFPEKPTNYVTDPEDILSLYEEAQLNDRLKAFEDSTTNQVFVFIDKRLHGDIDSYSKKIFNRWAIGQKDKNNGVLIAVFVDDREHRIQVGYGLEKALPSSLCLEILDEDMAPEFKDGNYYKGIKAGVDKLIYYTKNEYTPRDPNKRVWIAVVVAFAINILFAVVNLASLKKFSKKKRKRYTILVFVYLLAPLLGPAVYLALHSTNGILLSFLPFGGALASILLCVVISDKESGSNDYEDDYYQQRRYNRRTESSSDDKFDGGGGGSSGDGGASSHW